MMIDRDATSLAMALAKACETIIRYEEHRQDILRKELGVDAVDELIDAMRGDRIDLSERIEELGLSFDTLSDAAAMTVHSLLIEANRIGPDPLKLPPSGEIAIGDLVRSLARLQLLDAWFEGVFNFEVPASSAQVAFRDAFAFDGAITLPDGALLLPRRLPHWRCDLEEDSIGLLASHLRHLAYLPSHLRCSDPDLAGADGGVIVGHYVRWDGDIRTVLPVPADPVIAVAPLAERGSDVAFLPNVAGTHYALELGYDEARLDLALRQALKDGVHVLLVPEMALPEGDLNSFDQRIGQLIVNAQADWFAANGRSPSLRLVLAGVLGPVRGDGYHRNYAVAFDANGARAPKFEQRKLSHWNLRQYEQILFGIDRYHSNQWPLADPVIENSLPGDRLSVLEIPGIGRTATLICADMSQTSPGD